jgi:hypothetical protein
MPEKSPTLIALSTLEAKYLGALAKVRELIEMEGGSPTAESAKEERPQRQTTPPNVPQGELAKMTRPEAIQRVMEDNGSPMTKHQILDELVKRGHPTKDHKQVIIALSASKKRFHPVGDAQWAVGGREPEIPGVELL